jgi:hypothetical protein
MDRRIPALQRRMRLIQPGLLRQFLAKRAPFSDRVTVQHPALIALVGALAQTPQPPPFGRHRPTPAPTISAPAAQPPSAIQSWVCQAVIVHCTPCATTLTPKIARPALTIGATDCVSAAEPIPPPLLPPLRLPPAHPLAPGQIRRFRAVKGACDFSASIFSASSGPSKSIRGFNGSLIAIYLRSKIPAPHPGEYAAAAYRRPSPADEILKLKPLLPERLTRQARRHLSGIDGQRLTVAQAVAAQRGIFSPFTSINPLCVA